MPNRHPSHRRKNIQRFGSGNGKYKIMRRAATDLAEGKQDTDCRGATPPSPDCPKPKVEKTGSE